MTAPLYVIVGADSIPTVVARFETKADACFTLHRWLINNRSLPGAHGYLCCSSMKVKGCMDGDKPVALRG